MDDLLLFVTKVICLILLWRAISWSTSSCVKPKFQEYNTKLQLFNIKLGMVYIRRLGFGTTHT
jgi:hypothetical protein